MPPLPNDSQGGEGEGEGTPPSLRRLAGTAEGSEDASKEALQVMVKFGCVVDGVFSIVDGVFNIVYGVFNIFIFHFSFFH